MYSEIVLDHNMHPFNEGALADANVKIRLENASCGDEFTVELKINKQKIITAKFHGRGCAISKAACDILIDEIISKSTKEAKLVLKNYHAMIKGEKYEQKTLGEALALQNIATMPARIKCALLICGLTEKI